MQSASRTGSPLPDEIALPRVVAIARGMPRDRIERIADGLVLGGIRAFEITLGSPDALGGIESVARRSDGRLLVGAGTVLEIEGARQAANAGAGFIVCPHTDPALIDWAASHDLRVFPGAFTPTEIVAAWRAGATGVKLFPASVAGPAFIREFRGPFPQIPLIATGGISADSASGFIAAGAAAVGVGSWLMGDGEPHGVAARAAQLIRNLAEEDG